MENEIRKVFAKQVENFDLNDSTRNLIRKCEEILTYDYKVPMRVDDFLFQVEMLKKKILNKYMDKLTEYMEDILYRLSKSKFLTLHPLALTGTFPLKYSFISEKSRLAFVFEKSYPKS